MILSIDDDFDLAQIAESGQCFRWERTEGDGWRILHGARCLYAAPLGGGEYSFSCGEAEFAAVWRDYFDLDENYAAIRARIDPAEDPYLCAASERGKGIRILRQDPWEMLVTFLISQNRNIPAIRRSVALLAEAAGTPETDAAGRTFFAFPAPAAVAALGEAGLRRCALGYRAPYVLAAAEAVAAGTLDLEALRCAGAAECNAALTALYGVGPKVASCIRLFGLHQLDAFPRDVWIRRVLEQAYPKGYPYERYAPYNGVYQQYLFAYSRAQAAKA